MTCERKMARHSSLDGHSSLKSNASSTFLRLLVVLGAVVGHCNSEASARDGEPLLYSAVLDLHRKFVMSWTPGVDNVTIEIQVEARGYVGLGFSPSGGMKGADMVLGWVDKKGEPHLTDRYATGNSIPVIDAHQDVTLIRGYSNATHTTLRFRRPWVTCDQLEDMDITADTQRIIYAYGDVTPSPTATYLPYHSSRGMRRLYVKEPRLNAPAPSNDLQYWDVRAPNILVPEQRSTLYWCSLFKIPEMNGKTHYIANEPLISKASLQFVRHIILYGCHLPNSSQHLEHLIGIKGAQCYSPDMPLAWQFCNSPLATWAVGSEGTALPDHVGIPLGEQWTGSTYFMLEVHYDNPNKMSGIVDNSGLRLFYTKKLRQNDGGILDVGHRVSPLMVVGQHNKDWVNVGHCSSNCTEQALPPGGIRIIGGLLHTHLLGRSLKLQHIRNGTELSPIIQDNRYDFSYQQERVLLSERSFLPKDRLILSCHYDSSDRTGPTFGGLGTQEEMCLAFLLYYPRLPLIRCNSLVDKQAFYRAIGIEETNIQNETASVKEDVVEMEMKKFKRLVSQQDNLKGTTDISLKDDLKGIIIKKPLALQNQTVFGILHERSFWTHADVVARLQNLYKTGPFESFCLMRNETLSLKGKLEQSLSYEPYKPEEQRCTATQKNPWLQLI